MQKLAKKKNKSSNDANRLEWNLFLWDLSLNSLDSEAKIFFYSSCEIELSIYLFLFFFIKNKKLLWILKKKL